MISDVLEPPVEVSIDSPEMVEFVPRRKDLGKRPGPGRKSRSWLDRVLENMDCPPFNKKDIHEFKKSQVKHFKSLQKEVKAEPDGLLSACIGFILAGLIGITAWIGIQFGLFGVSNFQVAFASGLAWLIGMTFIPKLLSPTVKVPVYPKVTWEIIPYDEYVERFDCIPAEAQCLVREIQKRIPAEKIKFKVSYLLNDPILSVEYRESLNSVLQVEYIAIWNEDHFMIG